MALDKIGNHLAELRTKVAPDLKHKYAIVVWLMALWMAITWFFPVIMEKLVNITFLYRAGAFVNMNDVRRYFMVSDGLFLFLCVFSTVMLLLSTMAALYYIYKKVKHSSIASKYYVPSLTETTTFRIALLVGWMIMMFLVVTASILSMVCIDHENVRGEAINAKYLPTKSAELQDMRMYAKHAFEMATGVPAGDTHKMWGGAGIFLTDGILLQAPNGSSIMLMTNSSFMDAVRLGNVMIKSTGGAFVAVTEASAPSIMRGDLNEYNMTGPKLYLSPVMYTTGGVPAGELGNIAMNAARVQGTEDDISATTVEYYVLHASGVLAPTPLEMSKLANSRVFSAAVSLGYLVYVQNTLAKRAVIMGDANMIDLTQIVYSTEYCRAVDGYTGILFFISFLLLIVIMLVIMLYQVCWLPMKEGRTKYVPVADAEDFHDEEDTDTSPMLFKAIGTFRGQKLA